MKTTIKAGEVNLNHNEALIRSNATELKAKTCIKAGGIALNHNEVQNIGFQAKTQLKAGKITFNHNESLACPQK